MPFKTIEDAEAYALAAHNKAAEYYTRIERLEAENACLKAELKRAKLDAAREVASVRAMNDNVVKIRTALQWVYADPSIVPFVQYALTPGNKVDALARKRDVDKEWAKKARKFWQTVDGYVGLVDAETKRIAARFQQGDGF